MAKYAWPAGSTSKTVLLYIQDSASTTGAGKTGVSAGGVNVQQIRVLTNNTVAVTTVSVTNLALLTDAYLSGGILPVDATNAPGWYRFDIPNEVLSVGAVTAGISIVGSLSTSNIMQLALEIQLQNTPADVVAKAGVTVSVSTLYPAVVRQWDATSVSSSNLAVTDFTTRINANVQQWSGVSVSTNNVATWASISTANVTSWAGGATSLSDLAIANSVAASVSAVVFGTAMTEAYAADGATFNLAQFCYQMWSFLSEFSISGVSYQAMRLDGTTGAMTFSLDDATTPTEIERIA